MKNPYAGKAWRRRLAAEIENLDRHGKPQS